MKDMLLAIWIRGISFPSIISNRNKATICIILYELLLRNKRSQCPQLPAATNSVALSYHFCRKGGKVQVCRSTLHSTYRLALSLSTFASFFLFCSASACRLRCLYAYQPSVLSTCNLSVYISPSLFQPLSLPLSLACSDPHCTPWWLSSFLDFVTCSSILPDLTLELFSRHVIQML